MKPFSLEEYLANPKKKIVMRDGRKVKRVLCTDAMGPYPIVVLIEKSDNTEDFAVQYTKEGKYFINGMNNKDLFFASEKHEKWTPVYRERTGQIRFGYAYSTKKEAEEASKYDTRYITTTKVEWEE